MHILAINIILYNLAQMGTSNSNLMNNNCILYTYDINLIYIYKIIYIIVNIHLFDKMSTSQRDYDDTKRNEWIIILHSCCVCLTNKPLNHGLKFPDPEIWRDDINVKWYLSTEINLLFYIQCTISIKLFNNFWICRLIQTWSQGQTALDAYTGLKIYLCLRKNISKRSQINILSLSVYGMDRVWKNLKKIKADGQNVLVNRRKIRI